MQKENYIPFSAELILEKQLEHLFQTEKNKQDFKKLFHILEHYFHYEGFNLNQKLKLNYAHFDPDRLANERELYKSKSNLAHFKKTFQHILEKGNFAEVNKETIHEAIQSSDLVGLNLHIDFNDFQDYFMHARGLTKTREKVKKWLFWKKEIEIEYYDRVVLYLHYNSETHFKQKKVNTEELPFAPNSIVLKIFKRVPKNDLETIFPNAEPKMSLTDKLLLWIPAIGGGVPILSTKVIPALIKIEHAYKAGNLMHLQGIKNTLIQSGVALGVLGLYLFRQYKGYVNKKNNFKKMLTDSLYFKNLGNNGGVFHTLLDASEEEEMKESMLAYAFLWKNQSPISADQLDDQIESWFQKEFNTSLDFDVNDALSKLQHIGLAIENQDKWTVLPIEDALKKVDEIWDGIFEFY
jgi:hypothetical protein